MVASIAKLFEFSLEYPKEYNPRVHGPFNPSVYYGKPDPLSQVKLGELGAWLSRRDKSFKGFSNLVSRACWRYRFKYVLPKYANAVPIYQFIFVAFTASYFLNEYSYRSKNGFAIYH